MTFLLFLINDDIRSGISINLSVLINSKIEDLL